MIKHTCMINEKISYAFSFYLFYAFCVLIFCFSCVSCVFLRHCLILRNCCHRNCRQRIPFSCASSSSCVSCDETRSLSCHWTGSGVSWKKDTHHLTHWGRVTHICVSKLTITGSDNGLSPGRRQAIIWTNVGILSIGHLGTNFSEF